MASQKDVQDLLRLLTTGRNKLSMLEAMGRVQALQKTKIRSISEIAASSLPTLKSAITDDKAAKSLLAACKAHLKSGDATPGKGKRAAGESLASSSKRQRSQYDLSDAPQTPAELEASLELPQPSKDEEAIEKSVTYTNRAPLVLAFAVELLKYTMPEQPPSGRLSLAQAVVSANSRSKAVSLGIEKGKGAEEEGWGRGQPVVRVLGREITVLKRTGYKWRGEAEKEPGEAVPEVKGVEDSARNTISSGTTAKSGWLTSEPVVSKQSKFVARSITISSPSDAKSALSKLLFSNHDLREASHNVTAWRAQGDHGIIEDCDDDGESGGGRHLLGLLQSDNIVGVLLAVTRWYGGIFLGPDRWRIMSQVSRDSLSQRLRVAGVIGQEALWGLDLEAMRSTDAPVTGGTAAGMPIHKPEGARAYLLKSFGSPPPGPESPKKKRSGVALDREREENLGLLLGALDMLFESWVKHIGREELDRRAWGWYVQVRPDVESGTAGWGGKGDVKLSDILALRRKG